MAGITADIAPTDALDTKNAVRAPKAGQALADVIDGLTMPAELVEKLAEERVRCTACGHLCNIGEGKRGICQVRFNRGGTLFAPANYVAALQCDPIEKKPYFHIVPGQDALTFGMLGCDFHCGYCQNWLTSQALRDDDSGVRPQKVSPDELVATAKRLGARMVVSSYNEPLITAEWAVQVFKLAKQEGMLCGFVSNGNTTPQVLDYIRPFTDAYKIDLKSHNDKNYRKLGGTLQNVLDSIRRVHERGFWLEIVSLIIPGFNSEDDEIRRMADSVAAVSPDIPWHVTAYHQDYNMTDNQPTSVQNLLRACEIGREAGLNYVYAGNLPGRVHDFENTRCTGCNGMLVERFGYRIQQNRVAVADTGRGTCPDCGVHVPGIWA